MVHPASRATHPGGSHQGLRVRFFINDSCGLFKQIKFGGKSYSQGVSSRKNFNCGQFMDDKYNFFCGTNFR